MLGASPGLSPKNEASNSSTSRVDRNAPHRVLIFPTASGSASYQASMSQRSGGTSVTASTPPSRRLQNDSGSLTPPGNRQPIPTIAIGSSTERAAVRTGVFAGLALVST